MSSLEKLNTNQKTAVEAILSGKNKQEAAEAAGVTARTFSRWMQQRVFVAAIDEGKGEIIAFATTRLVATMDKAVDLIDEVLDGTGGAQKRHSIQLRAAKIALDAALKLIEVNDVIRRLEELERFYENHQETLG